MIVLLILFYLLFPAIIIFFTEKSSILNKIGTVIIAYFCGLVLGNIGIFPSPSSGLKDLLFNGNINLTKDKLLLLHNNGIITNNDILYLKIKNVQNILSNITVPIALPFLLFSLNIRKWIGMLKSTIIALLTGIVSVLIIISLGYFLFNNKITDLWKISGMLVGLYTGGTPNLASLKLMLNVNSEVYILTHTFDTFIGIFYLIFLLSAGKFLFRKFLGQNKNNYANSDIDNSITINSYNNFLKLKVLSKLIVMFFISILIFVFSYFLSLLFSKDFQVLVIILSITTLSILLSVFIKEKFQEKTYETGMYFILIFSIVVASMADFNSIFSTSNTLLLIFIIFCVFGSLFLHVFLSKLFKVDGDTLIISSTALICSPPFVPVVADSLKNKEIIIPGIAIGIIGYAVGNYLGVTLAMILKTLT